MRTHVWTAALVVVLGLALRSHAAPILVTGSATQTTVTPASFFTSLKMPSFLASPSNLSSFFPSMPSIDSPNGYAATAPIPLTNGQPNADYFKLFNLQTAPRVH